MLPAAGSQNESPQANAEAAANTRRESLLKRTLRPLLPKRLISERGIVVRLGPRAGRLYLALRLLDGVSVGAPNRRKVAPGARAFLFVCFGNIMRSPMAERMLKRAIPEHAGDTQVTSAGIHASAGSPAHPRARIAAHDFDLPLEDHRSRLLTAQMVEQADAVFAMDFQNKAELLALYPEAKHKIYMLAAYAEGADRCREIPDPYFGDQDDARRCYRVLQACIDNLAASLWPASAEDSRQPALPHPGTALSSPTGPTQR